MKNISLSPVIATTCVLASSVFSALASDKPETKMWREVSSGSHSNIDKATHQVILSQEQWQKWWNNHTNTQNLPEDAKSQPPKVDFNKESILIATMGMRSTGGHTIQFSDIRREGKSLKAVVTTTSPARDAMVTMALTYPFAVIAIPKFDGPIEFVTQAK